MLIHFTPRNFAEKCCLKLVILGADHLTFGEGGGGYRWFGKKISCRLISRGKKPCKEIPRGKKFLHWKKYLSLCIILEKKVLHCCMSGKKFYLQRFEGKILTQTRSPIPPLPPTKVKGSAPELFFFIFCSVCLIVLIYGLKDPFPLHKYLTQRQSCSWQYNNSYCWHQRWYKRGGSICMGCYGWFIVLVG